MVVVLFVAWRGAVALTDVARELRWLRPSRLHPALTLTEPERVTLALARDEARHLARTLARDDPRDDPETGGVSLDAAQRAGLAARLFRLREALATRADRPLELADPPSPPSRHAAAFLVCERSLPERAHVAVRLDVFHVDAPLFLALDAMSFPRTFRHVRSPSQEWRPGARFEADALWVLDLGAGPDPAWDRVLDEQFTVVDAIGGVRLLVLAERGVPR